MSEASRLSDDDLRGGVVRRPVGRLAFGRHHRAGSVTAPRWWPFALPAFVLLGVFFVLPFLLNIRFAFTDWSGFQSAINWTGIDNFRTLNQVGYLWPPVEVTLKYALIATIVQNTFSLSMALLLHETTRMSVFFRALFFIPVLIAPVAAGYIWHAILAPNGPLNGAIGILDSGFHYEWLGHPTSALVAVASIDAWRYSGLVTLVYIAGLNAIPRSLTEAAKIDGAGAWQRFWRVRFRLLAPAFTFRSPSLSSARSARSTSRRRRQRAGRARNDDAQHRRLPGVRRRVLRLVDRAQPDRDDSGRCYCDPVACLSPTSRGRPVIVWERGSRWVGENWKVTVLVLIAIPWIFVPLWVLLVNSFKPYTEAALLTLSLPKRWAILSNYGTALHQWGFLSALKNSAIVVIPTMLVVVLCGSLAAWAFARSQSMTMKVAFNISVLSILLPPAVLPTIYLLEKLHLQATLWGYALSMMGTRMGIVIFLATGFLRHFRVRSRKRHRSTVRTGSRSTAGSSCHSSCRCCSSEESSWSFRYGMSSSSPCSSSEARPSRRCRWRCTSTPHQARLRR